MIGLGPFVELACVCYSLGKLGVLDCKDCIAIRVLVFRVFLDRVSTLLCRKKTKRLVLKFGIIFIQECISIRAKF